MGEEDWRSLVNRLGERFEADWSKCGDEAFVEFVLALRRQVDAGRLSQPQAARAIAGAMFVPGVDDDPLREEIVIVAGDLERPSGESPRHSWRYLSQLIDELADGQSPRRA